MEPGGTAGWLGGRPAAGASASPWGRLVAEGQPDLHTESTEVHCAGKENHHSCNLNDIFR